MCIQDTFAPLLRNCAQLAAAGENTDKRTSEILDKAHDFVVQLADIYDFVSPCFPEKYAIFRVIFAEYHQHLAFMLDCIGACAQQLANSDILKARTHGRRSCAASGPAAVTVSSALTGRTRGQVMGWISGYQETLGDLGIEEEEARFPQGGSRGTTLLINKYIERMHATLHAWFVNILEASALPAHPAPAMEPLCVPRRQAGSVPTRRTSTAPPSRPTTAGCGRLAPWTSFAL